MLRKMMFLSGLFVVLFSTTAFIPAYQEAEENQKDGIGLVLLLLAILILAIFLIFMSRQTPKNVTRYNLDKPGFSAHGEPVAQPAVVESLAEPLVDLPADVEASAEPVVDLPVDVESRAEPVFDLPVAELPADDLTIIEGIGPKIAELLNAAGIKRYDQLANVDVEYVKNVLREGGSRFGLADPTSWIEQARLAAVGDLVKLKELQDTLKGGK